MLEIYNGRKCFYQWDINQKVKVLDDAVKELHFDNGTGKALVCAVYEYEGQRVADVPNILLQAYLSIRVYAYCGECVRYEKVYEVEKRSKPEDYIYTETEVKRYEDLEKRVYNLEQGGADVDLTNYYTKAETDSLLEGLEVDVDLSNYYTKEETDAAIDAAADSEEYELIETITLKEELTNIERTGEPDGTELKLKALMILAKIPPVITTEGYQQLYTSIGKRWALVGCGSSFVSAANEFAIRHTYQQKNGIWDITGQYGVSSANANTVGQVSTQKIIKTNELPEINYIKIYTFGKGFPEGMVIDIWGVRADA